MESALKTKLEGIVSGAIEYFEKHSVPSRIILDFLGYKSRNDAFEILSRVETHFLNNSFRTKKGVKVVNSLVERAEIKREKGDCYIDVSFLLRKEGFREFLLKDGIKNYARGFPEFEKWAGEYAGEYKKELGSFLEAVEKRNASGNGRIFPPLESSNIEAIFDEIYEGLSYQLIS